MLLICRDGSYGSNGVLCAIDSQPATLSDLSLRMTMKLFAELIAAQLDAEADREHLAESESRFRTLFEQSPLAIHICDPTGQTLTVNPAFERAFGVSADAMRAYNVLNDPQPHANPDYS